MSFIEIKKINCNFKAGNNHCISTENPKFNGRKIHFHTIIEVMKPELNFYLYKNFFILLVLTLNILKIYFMSFSYQCFHYIQLI